LARELNVRRVTALIGSGVSHAYGFPTWQEFAAEIVQFTLAMGIVEAASELRPILERFAEDAKPGTNDPRQSGEQPPATVTSRLAWSDRTLTVLGLCDELFRRHGRHDDLRQEMARLVTKPPVIGDLDPLRIMIDRLRIRR